MWQPLFTLNCKLGYFRKIQWITAENSLLLQTYTLRLSLHCFNIVGHELKWAGHNYRAENESNSGPGWVNLCSLVERFDLMDSENIFIHPSVFYLHLIKGSMAVAATQISIADVSLLHLHPTDCSVLDNVVSFTEIPCHFVDVLASLLVPWGTILEQDNPSKLCQTFRWLTNCGDALQVIKAVYPDILGCFAGRTAGVALGIFQGVSLAVNDGFCFGRRHS